MSIFHHFPLLNTLSKNLQNINIIKLISIKKLFLDNNVKIAQLKLKRTLVKVTVEKIDDINYILSGTVENSLIKKKVEKRKVEIAKEDKKDDTLSDEKIEQDAASHTSLDRQR